MHGARARQGGFTLVEVSIVCIVMGMAAALFASNFHRAQELSAHERARMRNLVEQQRGMRTLESVLQAVDLASLSGFDDAGRATVPTFRRWLHDPIDGVTLGGAERLEWQAHGEAGGEIREPGRVVLVGASDSRVVARKVPRGGFQVQRVGRRLWITLETFQSGEGGVLVRSTSRTAVFLGRGEDA